METKKILLWGQDDLLSSSVKLFLTSQQGWEVVEIPQEENLEAMIQAVDEVNPYVVLVHQGNCNSAQNLTMKLLKKHPEIKVILFELGKEVMEIYSKQDVLVKSASDLIAVVQANLPDHPKERMELVEMKGGGAN